MIGSTINPAQVIKAAGVQMKVALPEAIGVISMTQRMETAYFANDMNMSIQVLREPFSLTVLMRVFNDFCGLRSHSNL